MFNNENSHFFSALQYVILPGKYLGNEFKFEYNAIFEFWQKQWSQEFTKINIETAIDATEFCRHEEVTALFHNGKVIAVALTDFLDIQCYVQQRHRNFIHYPQELHPLISIISHQHPIHTFSYLTVNRHSIDRPFRSQYSIADLIIGLALIKTLERKNAVLIGYSRNSRKTNELSYRLGCKPLLQNILVHGEPSDFIYFDYSSADFLKKHSLYNQMMILWSAKIAIHSPQIETFYQNQILKQNKGAQNETQFRNSL